MHCKRCEIVVKAELEKQGFTSLTIRSGEVEIDEEITPEEMVALKKAMEHLGLEIIKNNESILAEQIKSTIKEMIYGAEEIGKKSCSEQLTVRMGYSYNYLSNVFTSCEGTTIEKYLIRQRIERVKEILRFEEVTFSEVAHKMNFSSSAHLSQQFKKETGLTLTQYKKFHSRN